MFRHLLIVGLCSILALEALFPNANLADLSHVPDLLSHYNEHRKTSPDVTFSEFLRLHYDDSGHLATTPADHEKLPFSKRHHNRITFQIAQEPAFIRLQTTDFVLLKRQVVFTPITDTDSIASSIWQPPKA